MTPMIMRIQTVRLMIILLINNPIYILSKTRPYNAIHRHAAVRFRQIVYLSLMASISFSETAVSPPSQCVGIRSLILRSNPPLKISLPSSV